MREGRAPGLPPAELHDLSGTGPTVRASMAVAAVSGSGKRTGPGVLAGHRRDWRGPPPGIDPCRSGLRMRVDRFGPEYAHGRSEAEDRGEVPRQLPPAKTSGPRQPRGRDRQGPLYGLAERVGASVSARPWANIDEPVDSDVRFVRGQRRPPDLAGSALSSGNAVHGAHGTLWIAGSRSTYAVSSGVSFGCRRGGSVLSVA